MSVQGTPSDFSCTLKARASKARLWQIWTDVAGWPQWDTPLKEASLEGSPQLGSAGKLITQSGQQSSFTITEWVPQQSYAFITQLPGAQLTVRRFISAEHNDGTLEFTHHVRFSGALGWLFAALLGRGFMNQLEPVMHKLKQIAEGG